MSNNLSQIAGQLQAIWRQLGINQRLTLVASAAVVVIGLSAIVFWSSRADYALLYGKLDDAEAAKVVASLDEAKIPYKISQGGGTISVPSDKVHLVRMQLAAKGIPRGEGVGFEIFDKPNFGISDFVQRANYLRAVQGELARTISQVDSIEAARVMIVMPENRLLVDNQKRPTASVFVRVRGNAALPSQTVNAVRFLVANAVEGLAVNNVSVVDNLGHVLSDNAEDDSVAGLTSTQLTARRNLEQYLAKKAEDMLDKVLGPGQSVVRVAADINLESLTTTEEKYDPDSQVVRVSTTDDQDTETSSGVDASGPVGVAYNADTESTPTNSNAGASVNTTRTKKKTVNNEYEINKTVSNLIENPGGIKRLSAAVFVAAQYKSEGTNRVAQPRTPEELEKIKRVVQGALGIHEGDAGRQDEIVVEEMPFNDQFAVDINQQFEQQHRFQVWFDLARQLLYPAMALAVLFVFWRVFKKTPAESIPLGVPVGELAANGNGQQHLPGGGRHRAHVPRHGTVTVDVLNKLVKENPGNMTHAIRTWMSSNNSN